MQNMGLQVGKRQIGKVMILDVKGALAGPWALREREKIARAFSRGKAERVVLNLCQTTSLDTLGVKSLLEGLPKGQDIGVLCRNAAIMDILKRSLEHRRFQVFHNEEDLASAYGEDFVAENKGVEQRSSERLKTALPLEFLYVEDGEEVRFRGIVTNLNDSGLFAEYIDLNTAEDSLKRLDPYDLKDLHLILRLPNRRIIEADGIVVHRRLDGDQLGIGVKFLKIGDREQEEIRRILKIDMNSKKNPMSTVRKVGKVQ